MKQYCTYFKREVIKEVDCYRNKDNFTICKQGIGLAFYSFCYFLEKNQMERTRPIKD